MGVPCDELSLESAEGSLSLIFSGLCPKDDVLIPGERHIWEHRLDAFGFFGDPFNYSTTASSRQLQTVQGIRTQVLAGMGPA